MDFKKLSKTKFRAGVDIFSRHYSVTMSRYGTLSIKDLLSSDRILTGLDPASVTLDGQPFNLFDLQDILFNKACICDAPENPQIPLEDKIFDLTFDKTFE